MPLRLDCGGKKFFARRKHAHASGLWRRRQGPERAAADGRAEWRKIILDKRVLMIYNINKKLISIG